MGAQQPVHRGQRLANRRRKREASVECCRHCRDGIAPEAERVEHVIPTSDGNRRVQYCSPTCFVRDMQSVPEIEPR